MNLDKTNRADYNWDRCDRANYTGVDPQAFFDFVEERQLSERRIGWKERKRRRIRDRERYLNRQKENKKFLK